MRPVDRADVGKVLVDANSRETLRPNRAYWSVRSRRSHRPLRPNRSLGTHSARGTLAQALDRFDQGLRTGQGDAAGRVVDAGNIGGWAASPPFRFVLGFVLIHERVPRAPALDRREDDAILLFGRGALAVADVMGWVTL